MKTASKLLLLAVCGASCMAQAGPSGRSAIMAARLKKHASSAWLAHYLPDDRYKIAGGVWKYVSTDLDTYYHRPDSPNMLRQPANMVIGFSSAADAEDSGYLPDAGVYDTSPLGSQVMEDEASSKGKRILLSDKSSSVVLPEGWKRGPSTITKANYGVSTSETLLGPDGQRVLVSTITVTPTATNGLDFDLGKYLNASFMRMMVNKFDDITKQMQTIQASSGQLNSQTQATFDTITAQLKNMKDNAQITDVHIGGLAGVKLANPTPPPGQPRESYTFGRGHKMWMVANFHNKKANLNPLIRTFQFR